MIFLFWWLLQHLHRSELMQILKSRPRLYFINLAQIYAVRSICAFGKKQRLDLLLLNNVVDTGTYADIFERHLLQDGLRTDLKIKFRTNLELDYNPVFNS